MVRLDIRFDDQTTALLQSLLGTEFEDVIFAMLSPSDAGGVDNIALLEIDGKTYTLTADYEGLDYMGEGVDDLGVLRFIQASDSFLKKYKKGMRKYWDSSRLPINQKIAEIRIVNENHQIFEKGEQLNNFDMVKGVIFVVQDGTEISFERCDYDSDLIMLTTGHDLIDGYMPFEEVFEKWDETPEIKAVGSREVVVLK